MHNTQVAPSAASAQPPPPPWAPAWEDAIRSGAQKDAAAILAEPAEAIAARRKAAKDRRRARVAAAASTSAVPAGDTSGGDAEMVVTDPTPGGGGGVRDLPGTKAAARGDDSLSVTTAGGDDCSSVAPSTTPEGEDAADRTKLACRGCKEDRWVYLNSSLNSCQLTCCSCL